MNTNNCVSIIGIGRLGLCTALCFESAGYDVLGMDVVENYVKSINDKTLESKEPRVEEMLKNSKRLRATTNFDEVLNFSNLIFVLVATPTGNTLETTYDCTVLNNVLKQINDHRVENKHIVICCTVMPGYTERVSKELLKDCTNTTLSYNPEFIAQGNIIHGLQNPDMVLIGEGSAEAGSVIEEIHRKVVKNSPTFCRMSPSSAEITKIAINCFVTTKISYCNMISDIADRTCTIVDGKQVCTANKYDILNAVGNDSRIGTKCLQPGFGFGGPCFPRDNRALGSYAKSVGIDSCISDSTDKFNDLHAKYLAENMIKESKDVYVFEDVAYKPKCPVDIIEESHVLKTAKELVFLGKKVVVRDRASIIDMTKKQFGSIFDYEAF